MVTQPHPALEARSEMYKHVAINSNLTQFPAGRTGARCLRCVADMRAAAVRAIVAVDLCLLGARRRARNNDQTFCVELLFN